MRQSIKRVLFGGASWVLRGDGARASIDMDFANGRYYGKKVSDLTVSRASTAYADDTSGNWTAFSSNVARITNKGLLVEESRTNSLQNSTMAGASNPSTPPTNWALDAITGLTWTVVGTGTELGINYIDLTLAGTVSGAQSNKYIRMDATTATTVSASQVWTQSVFLKVVSGNLAALSAFKLDIVERTSGGAFVADDLGSDIKSTVNSTLTRYTNTQTIGASGVRAQPCIAISVADLAVINVTIRIGWPQLELGSFATSPIPTTSGTVTRAADFVSLPYPSATYQVGTIFAGFTPAASTFRMPWQIDNGSGSANAILLDATSSTNVRTESYVAGAGTNRASATINASGTNKVASAWQDSDWATCANGGTVGTNTGAGGIPTITTPTLNFGGARSANIMNSFVTRLAVWPAKRLSNAALQSVST